jgi:phosphatidylglycerol:prolipoprotein diacylglycerol transferase
MTAGVSAGPSVLDVSSAVLAHTAFEMGGIAVGIRLYASALRRAGGGSMAQGAAFAVVLGCVLGAILGSKAAVWLQQPDAFIAGLRAPLTLWNGQSIVGALIGGWLGVEIAKRIAGVRRSTGDAFVFPLIAGIAIGRVGCFLAGLYDDTYGVPSDLPWAMDFGDGIRRHPTQLYDIAFVLALGALLYRWRHELARMPGLRFKLFLAGYLLWRVAIDMLKPVPVAYPLGLSGLQWLALVFLAGYLPVVIAQARRTAWEIT